MIFMYVCTGCSLLCDDIEVTFEAGKVGQIKNACRIGASYIRGCGKNPSVSGNPSDIDKAIGRAAELLSTAKAPAIFGLDNSTCEAQKTGIVLAKKLGANIGSPSSFRQGAVTGMILGNKVRSCTLDEVRDRADVIVYWGCDPQNTHPRLLSRFSFFPRGEHRQRGYEEDRVGIAIDVRESATAKVCRKQFYRIAPGDDSVFLEALLTALDGKVPAYPQSKRILELAGILKKAEFGVLFTGSGITGLIAEHRSLFTDFLQRLPDFHIIPVQGGYNARGFSQALFSEGQHSIIETITTRSADAVVFIGFDPVSMLPRQVVKQLHGIPIINIDPCGTYISQSSAVDIRAALSAGGTAIRMDGVSVTLNRPVVSQEPHDDLILKRIAEAL